MVLHTASYFVTKTQATIGVAGKWTSKNVLEKAGQVKRAIKDAYFRVVGKKKVEAQSEEIAIQLNAKNVQRKSLLLPIQTYRTTLEGYAARIQQQMCARNSVMTGGRGPFRRDFLWRRMRTGHLIGFATLFLVHEEYEAEYSALEKRLMEYERLCDNIKNTFLARTKQKEEGDCLAGILGDRLSDFEIGECIAVGCNGAVYEAERKDCTSACENVETSVESSATIRLKTKTDVKNEIKPSATRHKSSLAVKMIFNFESSNTCSIQKMTRAELINCGRGAFSGQDWQNGNRVRMKRLPPHPNIIRVHRAIMEKIPSHPQFVTRHPASLPPPTGFGRSSTMFLFMKRYWCTLEEFLRKTDPNETSRYLLCLQLLQGVAHLERNGVAHRDLKKNNILIEWDSVHLPRLVISDFGCCIVAEAGELTFPFISSQCDIRNGNVNVQPPEILNCQPASSSVLDYSKADAWACGLLLGDILRTAPKNYGHKKQSGDSGNSTWVIEQLIDHLLAENTRQRMTSCLAATILHLQLFGPKLGMRGKCDFHPSLQATLSDWLLLHASETLAYATTHWGRDSVVSDMFHNFLSSIDHESLSEAFSWWRALAE